MRMMTRCVVALAATATLGGCSLDLQSPNNPTEVQVTSSPEGVIALATGLQGRFAASAFNFAYMAGLVTDEFAATSAALISISEAEQGSVAPGTGVAENVFNSIYRTVRTADELLAGADRLAGSFDAGTRSGLKALAYTLKAEALGEALQSYQRIPINTFNVTTPVYVARSEALPYVRALLDSAAAQLAGTAPSTFFITQILTPGVNLPNMINMFRARYARMANDFPAALAAANLVPRAGPGALSVLTYPAPGVNPYSNVTGGTNGIAPRRQFRTSMAAADQRFGYFVIPSTTLSGRIGALLDPFSIRFAIASATQPVYFPDEALLIKAEALAVANDVPGAVAALDSVRTDCTARAVDDPKACLPAITGSQSQSSIAIEVITQRRFELFGTGLRWEDTRRSNGIRGPAAAPQVPNGGQRCWLPYAIGDRNANAGNVPADPVEPAPSATGVSCQT